ncbi:G-protein coupled receptor 39-like isoform X2 [Bufo gargarizans]|uniref:G-protein coupled receptor 39-like isoform X2 n=1 Tax=Bufo gargarizans TaxID=30331 RepID=UPI001CF2E597|nr:G-protein coupled receptor 39-like isoform X2 [Bufo gargarizans]
MESSMQSHYKEAIAFNACTARPDLVVPMPPVTATPETPVKLGVCAKSLVSLAYLLLLLAGIFGNTLVIRVLRSTRHGRSVQTSLIHHICSLACCNILQLALGIPTELYGSIWSPFPWPLGAAGCSGFYYLWEVLCYAAIFNVLSLSYDRHRATCQPLSLHVHQSSKVRLRICLLWIASLLAGLPVLFSIGLENITIKAVEKKQISVCTPLSQWMGLFKASVWASFLTYLGVLLAVAITCWNIRRTLRGNRSDSLVITGPNGSIQLLGRFCGGHMAVRRQNAQLLGCIVAVLAVCWLPFQSRRLMTVLRSKDQWTETYYRSYITLQPITNSFYYLSACLTPLLYNLTSRSFRRAFLHRITPCTKGTPPESGSWETQERDQGIRLSTIG